jgi:hypothetical protein
MGNWTPDGLIGQMFSVITKHVPLPVPSPLLWGDEAACRLRSSILDDLQISKYMYPFEFPCAPVKVVDLFVNCYGPVNGAYSSLNDAGRRAVHEELTVLWTRNNRATDGTTRIAAEYIELVGTTPSTAARERSSMCCALSQP